MKAIYLIAANTFRETIRDKVLYNILFFAALVILLSISFGQWSVFARSRVMQDFGLATMSISGLLLAVFVGVGMLGREIGTKTVYSLAVKPVPRYVIVFGKFLGLTATLTINYALMGLFFVAALTYVGGEAGPSLVFAVVLIWAEMGVIVAVALLFSSVTNTTLAAMFTLGFYIAGHFNDLVGIHAVREENPALVGLMKFMYYAIPNLEHFNVRSRVVYDLPIPVSYLMGVLGYGALYVLLFLTLSSLSFARKDL